MSKLNQAARFLKMNDLVQAERLYHDIIVSEPECGHAYFGMGVIALKIQQFDKAVSYLTKSCELLPNEVSPLLHLSEAFNGVHSEIDGLTVLEYALKHFSNQPLVHYRLGLQQIIMGKLDEALQSFQIVLSQTNDVIASYAMFELSRLGFHSNDFNELIAARLQQPKLDKEEKIILHYALGNVLDNQKDYQGAWKHFEQANLLQQGNCDFKTTELIPFFQSIKANNTSHTLRLRRELSDAHQEPIPIFILGLPRTGSTLLEFLLSEHPDIACAGEVSYLSREVDQYLSQATGLHYPENISELSSEHIQHAAKVYLQKLEKHAKGKKFVIDKLPANFQSIGLIYKLFPNAKVIHLQRKLPEVALSIFRNNFAQNEPYFCSLEEFNHYHNLYEDLMNHWNRECGEFIHEISFEQLIKNKTESIDAIIRYCGLQPIKQQKKKNRQANGINTLSNIQVRRPISATVMQNWHNYAQYLSGFINKNKITHDLLI